MIMSRICQNDKLTFLGHILYNLCPNHHKFYSPRSLICNQHILVYFDISVIAGL